MNLKLLVSYMSSHSSLNSNSLTSKANVSETFTTTYSNTSTSTAKRSKVKPNLTAAPVVVRQHN